MSASGLRERQDVLEEWVIPTMVGIFQASSTSWRSWKAFCWVSGGGDPQPKRGRAHGKTVPIIM